MHGTVNNSANVLETLIWLILCYVSFNSIKKRGPDCFECNVEAAGRAGFRAVAIVQVRSYDSLDQGGSYEGGKEWMDSEDF